MAHDHIKLTSRHRENYRELRQWLQSRIEADSSLTPDERAAADAEWAAFSKSLNEERGRSGARLLYGD